MSRDSIIYSELLKKEQLELSHNLRLFDIVIRYMDQSKQGRVRKMFEQIKVSTEYEKKMDYIDVIRKKLYEEIKNPIIDVVSLLDIKSTLKRELSVLGEEKILRFATLIYDDPEKFALSVLENISGSYTRIKTCNDSLEDAKEVVNIPATFKRLPEFDVKRFMDNCIKKEGASELAIYHEVLPYYPELAESQILTIELFKKLMDFNVLCERITNVKPDTRTSEEMYVGFIDRISVLAKELISNDLLTRKLVDFPAVLPLFDSYGYDKVYEKYTNVYKEVSDKCSNSDHYKTKLKPEMVLSEVNNEIVYKLGSQYDTDTEVFEYATRYFKEDEKQGLLKSINVNKELVNKLKARIHNDSLDDELNEQEQQSLLLDSFTFESYNTIDNTNKKNRK